jgi:translation initiation factor IF-3
MDWASARHEAEVKAAAADKAKRLQQKLNTPKEMQFTARIAGVFVGGVRVRMRWVVCASQPSHTHPPQTDHDLEVKLRRVTSWLEEGYR